MLFSAVFVVTTSTLAVADVDVFLSSQKQLALPSPLPTELARLVAEGRVSHTEPRLGTPTFVWAPRVTNAPNLRAAGLTPEEVARRALFTWAPLYRAQPATLAESPLLHVDDPGTGAVIVQFAHRVSGLDVFHQRLTLVFSQRLELVALSGAHAALPLRDAPRVRRWLRRLPRGRRFPLDRSRQRWRRPLRRMGLDAHREPRPHEGRPLPRR
jgi:hypothetical protein